MDCFPDRFYLASASPRRQALLSGVGLRFATVPVEIDESCWEGESITDFVTRMVDEKVSRAADLISASDKPELPILGADTCISFAGQILGKPRDNNHAEFMLRSLSGQTHEVYTAIALKWNTSHWRDLSRTRVTFGTLSEQEITAYCASGEPRDKAGAYAIQGLGCAFVKHLEGSYTGVVGLPMYETRRLLARIGISWL